LRSRNRWREPESTQRFLQESELCCLRFLLLNHQASITLFHLKFLLQGTKQTISLIRCEVGNWVMNTLYSTKVTATGGRHGQLRSEDGLLEMKLALPRQLGGKGDATNPETLFAGGYAACFENALLHVSRDAGFRFADEDVEVVAVVGLSRNESGGFVLSVALAVTVAGVDQKKAEELVESADKICPYSNAIRGNVDVRITVSVR
jgi:osmotically inducible protein OsmC